MTYLLNDIEDAIDRKFLVTKTINGQAGTGNVVHIMDADDKGGISVNYRVTSTGQDFSVKFDSIKKFCNWARPDSFIARYSESLSSHDIQRYIKMNNRNFTNFCLPIILLLVAVVWTLSLLLIPDRVTSLVVAACMTVLVAFLVTSFSKTARTKFMAKLYGKISTNWAGGGIVVR